MTLASSAVPPAVDARTDEQAVEPMEAFPLDALPDAVRQFTTECADSLSVAPELVAVPALVTLSAAIGNARRIRLKAGYEEPAALFATVMADTGSMKSPALRMATEPLVHAQTTDRRTWTTDTTVEKLAELLGEHKRGLTIIRDELIGWVKSLNQYRDGKGGDREFYLSAWSGAALAVDRKSNEKPLIVPRPFLSVVGCLPTDLLDGLEGTAKDDGFIQRFLFAWPEPVPVRWTDLAVTDAAKKAYHDLVTQLLELDWQGEEPEPIPITPSALALYKDWYDQHCIQMESPELQPGLKPFYPKLKGYCARLALIHALATDPEEHEIGPNHIEAAIAQINYFKGQAARVTGRLCRSVGVGDQVQRCAMEILRKAGRGQNTSRRALQRSSQFEADVFNEAWNEVAGRVIPLFRECTDAPTTDKVA